MKTDRELLELAARAAGIDARWSSPSKSMVLSYQNSCMEMVDKEWNPIKDDGDALRLSVKLRITIEQTSKGTRVYAGVKDTAPYFEDVAPGRNLAAATRLVIVKTAAEIQVEREENATK